MTIKQFIQNSDNKNGLFSWGWATTDPEKYRVYNCLLDNFLSDKEVAKIKFKPKCLYFWHLYAGYLQNYVLNGENKKPEIVKKCALSKRELKTLFS